MMTTMMLINDDGDDDGVNFEPEQDDGISYNFLHRLPPFLAHSSPLTWPIHKGQLQQIQTLNSGFVDQQGIFGHCSKYLSSPIRRIIDTVDVVWSKSLERNYSLEMLNIQISIIKHDLARSCFSAIRGHEIIHDDMIMYIIIYEKGLS